MHVESIVVGVSLFFGSNAGEFDYPAPILPGVDSVAFPNFDIAQQDIESGYVEGVRRQRLDVFRLETSEHFEFVGHQPLFDCLKLCEQALDFNVSCHLEHSPRSLRRDFSVS